MSNFDVFFSYTGKTGSSLADVLGRHLSANKYTYCLSEKCRADGTTFQAIQGCRDFVVILSPGCFDADKLDISFVKEISCAIGQRKKIIAVTMAAFTMPPSLPQEINGILRADAFVPITDKFDLFLSNFMRKLSPASPSVSTGSSPEVYEGEKPYVFISYSHKDSSRVLPIVNALKARGFRLWYDKGIEVGTEWPAYIESHLIKCSAVVVFLSDNCIDSVNCRNEINVAADLNKNILVAQLDESVEYKHGMMLQLSSRQKIFCNRHPSVDSIIKELERASILENCREGSPRKSTPSGTQSTTSQAQQTQQTRQAPSTPYGQQAQYTQQTQQTQQTQYAQYNQQAQQSGYTHKTYQGSQQGYASQYNGSSAVNPPKKKKSGAAVILTVVLVLFAVLGVSAFVDEILLADSQSSGGNDNDSGYKDSGEKDDNYYGDQYAVDAYITWYNTTEDYEDSWQFNAPYIEDGYMYIECPSVVLNMPGSWSGYNEQATANGIVSLYEDYTYSKPVYAYYEKASWSAGEAQGFTLQIPVTELSPYGPPTRIYVSLFADCGSETEIPINCYFDITWE